MVKFQTKSLKKGLTWVDFHVDVIFFYITSCHVSASFYPSNVSPKYRLGPGSSLPRTSLVWMQWLSRTLRNSRCPPPPRRGLLCLPSGAPRVPTGFCVFCTYCRGTHDVVWIVVSLKNYWSIACGQSAMVSCPPKRNDEIVAPTVFWGASIPSCRKVWFVHFLNLIPHH